MKKKLFLMVGIPGSGKSTFIKDYTKKMYQPYAVISRDDIRFKMVSENEPHFSKEKAVFKELVAEIKDSLSKNDITFADATHINECSRGKLLRALGESLKDIEVHALVFKVPVELAIERNNGREGRKVVPETAIRNMNSQFTMPSFEEGIDIVGIRRFDKTGRLVEHREEAR